MGSTDFLVQETEGVILNRMLAAVPNDLDKNEGSYIYDALAAVAAEVAQMKVDMSVYLERGFASTTYGEYLDRRCEEHGLTRRAAVKAEGEVVLSGTANTEVEARTSVSTVPNQVTDTPAVEFLTLEKVTIPIQENNTGSVVVRIQAKEAGVSGNVAAGTIKQMAVPGVVSVVNELPTSGGTDVENDTSLLERFLARVRNPGTSGNKADYHNWALEVEGIGAAQILPLWDGPGTVKVVLVDTDKQPASDELVNRAIEHIEQVRPIGPAVTVMKAKQADVNVRATLEIDGTRTMNEIGADFRKALEEYLKGLVFTSKPNVLYVKVGALLVDTKGVNNYANLEVKRGTTGGTSDIIIAIDEVAVIGAEPDLQEAGEPA